MSRRIMYLTSHISLVDSDTQQSELVIKFWRTIQMNISERLYEKPAFIQAFTVAYWLYERNKTFKSLSYDKRVNCSMSVQVYKALCMF